jgi:hypothetical protein
MIVWLAVEVRVVTKDRDAVPFIPPQEFDGLDDLECRGCVIVAATFVVEWWKLTRWRWGRGRWRNI